MEQEGLVLQELVKNEWSQTYWKTIHEPELPMRRLGADGLLLTCPGGGGRLKPPTCAECPDPPPNEKFILLGGGDGVGSAREVNGVLNAESEKKPELGSGEGLLRDG